MSQLKASAARDLRKLEKRDADQEREFSEYRAYLAALESKVSAGEKIGADAAGIIRGKAEDIDQIELVALNHFDHGVPGKKARSIVANSNVPREQRQRNRKSDADKITESNSQVMAKMDELIEALNAKV